MDNPRTDTARDHDDHALIDSADSAPSLAGGGGAVNLSADVGTEQDLTEIDEPDARTRVRKNHDQHHAQAIRANHPGEGSAPSNDGRDGQ